jgi:N-acetylmuramoyl-L-alanine amidase
VPNNALVRPPRAFRPGWLLLAALLVIALWFLMPRREGACGGIAAPDFASPRAAPASLRGARVVLNPGHGLTRGDDGRWGFQRPQPDGRRVFVLEDDSNIRVARAVRDALRGAGATVLSTRELEDTAMGESGQPRWREAARHHLERIGLPRGVWDSAGNALRGDCSSAQDLRARAYAANFWGADVILSLHSNAGRPDAQGTLVIYGSRSYLENAPADLEPKSACLGRNLARDVPSAIRLERPWGAATLGASRNYGENGFALMPAAILEVAFHTNRQDGEALQSPAFRQSVARGVVTALEAFFRQPKC